MAKESSNAVVCSDRLKISFFKLLPGRRHEEAFIDHLDRVLGNERYAIFKALGYYDIVSIYPSSLEPLMLDGGTIGGIKSFSTCDCFCFNNLPPNKIIDKMRKAFFSSITIISLKDNAIVSNGGYRNTLFINNKSIHIYVNSTGWGEQVIFTNSNSVDSLWKATAGFLSSIANSVIDFHSIMLINLNYMKSLEKNRKKISFKHDIGGGFDIKWFLNGNISNEDRESIIEHLKSHKISVGKLFHSFDTFETIFEIENGNWKQLLIAIRQIREDHGNKLYSSRLAIRRDMPLASLVSPCEIKENGNNSLSEKECKEIRKNLGDRIGTIMILAHHTISDAYEEFPSFYLMGRICESADYLKQLCTLSFDELQDVDDAYQRKSCLRETTNILDATYQRVKGIPVSREYNNLSFDVMPTNLRIYIDACEFIVDSALNLFSSYSYFKPYVSFKYAADHQHTRLGIIFPYYFLDAVNGYIPLTHEAMHILVMGKGLGAQNNIYDDLISTDEIKNILNNKKKYYILIQEILVEILDFEISYLAIFDKYISVEWKFLYEYMKFSQKDQAVEISDYILRTLCVDIWSRINITNSFDDMKGHHLREIIREHLKIAISSIRDLVDKDKKDSRLNKYANNFESLFSQNTVFEYQKTVQRLHPVLKHVYAKCQEVLKSESVSAYLLDAKEWIINKRTEEYVDRIIMGQIFIEEVKYPHLIPLILNDALSRPRKSRTDEKIVASSMVINLWNALKLKTSGEYNETS